MGSTGKKVSRGMTAPMAPPSTTASTLSSAESGGVGEGAGGRLRGAGARGSEFFSGVERQKGKAPAVGPTSPARPRCPTRGHTRTVLPPAGGREARARAPEGGRRWGGPNKQKTPPSRSRKRAGRGGEAESGRGWPPPRPGTSRPCQGVAKRSLYTHPRRRGRGVPMGGVREALSTPPSTVFPARSLARPPPSLFSLSLTSLGQFRQGVRRPPQGGPVRGGRAVLGQAGDDGREAGGLRWGWRGAGVSAARRGGRRRHFRLGGPALPLSAGAQEGASACPAARTHACAPSAPVCERTHALSLCTRGPPARGRRTCRPRAPPPSTPFFSHLRRHVFGRVGLVRHRVQGVLQLALGALPVGGVAGHGGAGCVCARGRCGGLGVRGRVRVETAQFTVSERVILSLSLALATPPPPRPVSSAGGTRARIRAREAVRHTHAHTATPALPVPWPLPQPHGRRGRAGRPGRPGPPAHRQVPAPPRPPDVRWKKGGGGGGGLDSPPVRARRVAIRALEEHGGRRR